MDLLRCALAHASHGQAVGADRYLVHVVADLTFAFANPQRR